MKRKKKGIIFYIKIVLLVDMMWKKQNMLHSKLLRKIINTFQTSSPHQRLYVFEFEFEFEFELNLNLNLLTTTHHNNDSTYEQSYNAKNNTDTCIHNIRVMSIEQ